jgi:hypothetical protein
MSADSDQFDFFVSYARSDNADGWVTRFIAELAVEHAKFAPDRPLKPFFDKQDIRSLDDWQQRIFNDGLAKSRLFVAFVSPNYFASEWCRREWKAWIDTARAAPRNSGCAGCCWTAPTPCPRRWRRSTAIC